MYPADPGAFAQARNTLHFDRRTKKKKKPTLRQNLQLVVEEEMPAKPIRSAGESRLPCLCLCLTFATIL